jgi:PAS domain S-box-containing protein
VAARSDLMIGELVLLKLITNLALLFTLIYFSRLLQPYLNRLPMLTRNIAQGLMFGFFGVVDLLTTIEILPGFLLDGRTIVVAVAAAYGGGVSGLVAAAVVSLFRLMYGGAGAGIGVLITFTAAGLGYLVYRYHARQGTPLNWISLVTLGGLVALQRVLWPVIVGGSVGQQLANAIALPVTLGFPLGTAALGLLLVQQRRQFTLEQALHESEERYRSVVSAMKEGVIVWDTQDRIIAYNQGAKQILRVTDEQLFEQQENIAQLRLIHPDGTPFPIDQFPYRVAMRTNEPQNEVVMGIERPDGSLVWLLVNARPLCKPDAAKPYAVLATFADITESKTMMEALVSERDLLRTLIDSTPDYIFIKNTEGRFVISNEAHARAVNTTPSRLIGKTAFDLFPPNLAEQFHADDLEIIQSGQALLNLERTTVDSQGNFKTVLTTKVPLRSRDGQITGLVGISRDITERKLVEQQALELAAERERMKVLQRFIGDLSHDFRTPLTVINNSVYLLRKLTDPDRQQSQLDKLEAQVMRMDELLGDLLKLDYLIHGESPFVFKPQDVNAIVREVVAVLEVSAAERGQEITLTPGHDLPAILADYNQLKQCVASVIENAVHYTPDDGTIAVQTMSEGQRVMIRVEDTGIGIAQNDQPHIFEPFYRADQARSTTNGRSGLGLAIAKRIIEAHKGSIEFQSRVGEGSIFVISLPAVPDEIS